MKFTSIRDLRGKSAEVCKKLPGEGEMIVTNNGRPIAILAVVNESNLLDRIVALLDHIEHRGHLVASSPLSNLLPDPGDQPFLEVAVAGQAVCLVTGNHAHFPPKQSQGVKVPSPSEFLSFYRRPQKQKSK